MKRISGLLCALIAAIFIFLSMGTDCFAAGETSRDDYVVKNGVTESMVYVTVDGGYNVRTHILRISPEADVCFKASYGGYYADGNTASMRKEIAKNWDRNDWTFETVRAQAADYELAADTEGEVIAASNGDFYYVDSGKPEGSLVIEGSIIRKSNKKPFFAVLKNGNVVIRKAGGQLTDTAEAVGGRDILLWNGKPAFKSDGLRNPREAIGICSDGTVVIVNVDGREPASAGVTMQELAEIMKAQGCKKALNLDGGGSASFMTKRADEDSLQLRSNPSDGPERCVASALLVVSKKDPANYAGTEKNIVIMKDSDTGLSVNGSGLYRYRINGKKQTGFFAVNGEAYLFSGGKGVTTKVKIGNSVYSFSKGRLKSCSDSKAANVIIGYCGGQGEAGKNLIYAYHEGDGLLNIGLNPRNMTKNGSMKRWTSETVADIPWYAVRADIKRLYVANGVTNLGGYSLYSTRGSMPGGAEAPACLLRSVRLPSSMKEIGDYSLYNKPDLTDIKLPAKTAKIGKSALRYSGKKTLTFKNKTPPSFGKYALKSTGFSKVYVKKSNAWKKFVKNKGFKKCGYKKSVNYKS